MLSILTQNNRFEEIGVPYVALWVDSMIDANLLPGGSSIDETQWQIIGPQYNFAYWQNGASVDVEPADVSFPSFKDYMTIFILNISAGAHTMMGAVRWKYISPREGAA